ncbi:MAG: hypothetical protein ABTQ25_19305 [Nitrosomonas ureae]
MSAELVNNAKFNPLSPTRMPTRSNVKRTDWDVIVTPDTKLEDLLQPSYWTHVAGSTFQGPVNYVDVHWEDKSQLARLYVLQYDKTSAKMGTLEYYEFEKSEDINFPEKYFVEWTGPITQYRVIDKETKAILRDRIPTKTSALDFINEQQKRMK